MEGRARTGHFDTPNAIAKFVEMAQRNKKSQVPGLYGDVLKSFVPLRYHNELRGVWKSMLHLSTINRQNLITYVTAVTLTQVPKQASSNASCRVSIAQKVN